VAGASMAERSSHSSGSAVRSYRALSHYTAGQRFRNFCRVPTASPPMGSKTQLRRWRKCGYFILAMTHKGPWFWRRCPQAPSIIAGRPQVDSALGLVHQLVKFPERLS
jgi:hypothetical protein